MGNYLAKEIGEIQLLDALDLFEDDHLISSLTLAGAAEEIFGKMPPEKRSIAFQQNGNFPNIFEVFSARLSDEHNVDLKQIRKEMNKARNIAKHYISDYAEKDGTFKISQSAVESMLIRCITQYSFVVNQETAPKPLIKKIGRFLRKVIPQ